MRLSTPILILGIWLVISPWVLGFFQYDIAAWNAIAVGVILIIFSLSRTITKRK